MDNFHLIVVYFISLSIIGIEGEWYNAYSSSPGTRNPASPPWYETYYQSRPQSPGSGYQAPQPASPRHQTYTAPPISQQNKRPASPSPSTAPKRQKTGASPSTSSPVNTKVELYRIMDDNRDGWISSTNFQTISRTEIFTGGYITGEAKQKLRRYFLNNRGELITRKRIGYTALGSCPVDLATMNEGIFSENDLVDKLGIFYNAAIKIIRKYRHSENGTITAAELVQFFEGTDKFDE